MSRGRPYRIPWRGVALGLACGLVSWLFTLTPFGRGVEDWLQDASFAYRGGRPTQTKVLIVGLDDDSLASPAQADGRRQSRAGRGRHSSSTHGAPR